MRVAARGKARQLLSDAVWITLYYIPRTDIIRRLNIPFQNRGGLDVCQ